MDELCKFFLSDPQIFVFDDLILIEDQLILISYEIAGLKEKGSK